MKKYLYTLSASLLLCPPVLAQTQNPEIVSQEQNITNSPVEEAQTIFFSEDFLDELDDLPVNDLNQIPLEKQNNEAVESVPQAQTAPVETQQQNTISTESSAQPSTLTVSDTEAQNINLPESAPLPQKLHIEENINVNEAASLPVPAVVLQTNQNAVSNNDTLSSEKPALKNEQNIPLRENIPVETTTAPILPQENSVVNKQVENTTEPLSTENNINKEENLEQSAPQPKIQIQQQSNQAEKFSKPQISEPAPKKNTFSLDDDIALPSGLLQEQSFSTNVINKGLNISPEQRARMLMRKKFGEMDLNQDGFVTQEEFIEYKTQEAQKIAIQVFQQIDNNGDDILSAEEYDILMNKMIENYIKSPYKK